jgi:hypothetical protein
MQVLKACTAVALALALGASLVAGCGAKKQATGAAVPQAGSMKITGPDGKPVPTGKTSAADFEALTKKAK